MLTGEICKKCGKPVAKTAITWWRAPDELWLRIYGTDAGIRCIPCFTEDCEAQGVTVYWLAVEEMYDAQVSSPTVKESVALSFSKLLRIHDYIWRSDWPLHIRIAACRLVWRPVVEGKFPVRTACGSGRVEVEGVA
jgi:hypothetical protein